MMTVTFISTIALLISFSITVFSDSDKNPVTGIFIGGAIYNNEYTREQIVKSQYDGIMIWSLYIKSDDNCKRHHLNCDAYS